MAAPIDMRQAYSRGFLARCAETGMDPLLLLKKAKARSIDWRNVDIRNLRRLLDRLQSAAGIGKLVGGKPRLTSRIDLSSAVRRQANQDWALSFPPSGQPLGLQDRVRLLEDVYGRTGR